MTETERIVRIFHESWDLGDPKRGASVIAHDCRFEDVARGELQARAEAALREFREDLSERDVALLDRRILSDSPATLQVLGDRFGTSREAVRQAETRLMKRLKTFLRQKLGDIGQVKIGPV